MAQHCRKHDITFSEGGTCWCCEQEKKKEQPEAEPAEVPPADADK